MSVLIKGMKMPKNCVDCEIRLRCGCKTANASGWLINEIDDNCPFNFVEIPTPHGRLIDVDALAKKAPEIEEYLDVLAPTVIEAEERNEFID